MKRNWKIYTAVAIVFAISSLATIVLPISEIARSVMASPAALALIAALYQIFRDEAAFEKEKKIKEEEKLHALSISSHMAVVAFNKHAEFSEKYLEVMRKGLAELTAKGPCAEALKLAGDLRETRLDYAAWVTKDTRDLLFPFEKALTQIGINHVVLKDMPVGDERSTTVQEASDLFMQVMEFEKGTEEKQIGVSKVVERIQDLLGINELTRLRKQVIKQANKALEATP
jgi:hypothetical protein